MAKPKVLLYMATSLDGYIAGPHNETPWSKEEWKSFAATVKKHKNIVIGRKTFNIMNREHEFEKLSDPRVVVLSRKKHRALNATFVSSPQKAITLLKKEGFATVLVAGGSKTNAAFFSQNLFDELSIDIEPFIFSRGSPLFSKTTYAQKLVLRSVRKIGISTVQLHYTTK